MNEESIVNEINDSNVINQFDNIRSDIESYHVNPQLEVRSDRIYVPCGLGKTDFGFFIYGIEKKIRFEQAEENIFAIIYNYLIRNSQMTDKDIPTFIKQIDTAYEMDYRSVFRLAIVVLQMIKNGYLHGEMLNISYEENLDNLKYAVAMINNYADLFSRLSGVNSRKIKINLSASGTCISLRSEKGIYVKDNTEFVSNAREIWYGRKIRYHLKQENKKDLEYILREVSPYDRFKEGQFEAIASMSGTDGHSVCIMPTGSGKSLVYYFLSLLQPLPLYVIAPTDILIKDQIRNLREIHRIDDVAHLQLLDGRQFSKFEAHNKLIYMTPMTLQNKDLLVAFRYINNGTNLIGLRETRIAPGELAAYIVLDEIHCLSNWSHDFRPEYLMLSRYLNKYLDRIKFRGFTATANYTVVEDVQKQLEIPEENFFSPIAFEKYNITYRFLRCKNEAGMKEQLARISRELIDRGERTIVFTKNDEISEDLTDVVGYEADVFSSDNPTSYYSFAAGKCKVLIASQELGVGINFPDIKNIIHFGLPLSKNEYIQEIGRAGRANEHVTSYVLFLEESEVNVPSALLKRSTKIEMVPELISKLTNDYADIYRMITNNCPTKALMFRNVLEFYNSFDYHQKALEERNYKVYQLSDAKQKLFMLYSTGFINDWYSSSAGADGYSVNIIIDICSTKTEEYRRNPAKILQRMQQKSIELYEFLGEDNRENIAKTNRARSPEDVIAAYIDWYYIKFLYHHNEQFLDLFEFITTNCESRDDEITDQIKDYFQLPFAQLRNDEIYFNSMSTKEILDKVITGIGRDTIVNVERIISNRYTYKLDLLLLFGHLIRDDNLEVSRVERILEHIPKRDIGELADSFIRIYEKCTVYGRIEILNFIEFNSSSLCLDYDNFWEKVYFKKPKDVIYYGLTAKRINDEFRRFKND